MRLRSFLGFAFTALALAAIFTPLDTLQAIGGAAADLVLTAADNPFSISSLVMLAATIVIVCAVAVLLIALIDRDRYDRTAPRRVIIGQYRIGVAGERLRPGDPVRLGADGRMYRSGFTQVSG